LLKARESETSSQLCREIGGVSPQNYIAEIPVCTTSWIPVVSRWWTALPGWGDSP